MTEDKLLERAQSGDRSALDQLCRLEWRGVYGVVYQAVRNPPEAQDLTQEVFLKAMKSLDQYRHSGVPFSAYLQLPQIWTPVLYRLGCFGAAPTMARLFPPSVMTKQFKLHSPMLFEAVEIDDVHITSASAADM